MAFSRAQEKDGRPQPGQIYLISLAGGEAQALTSVGKGAGGMEWSPDGKSIAFTSTEDPDEKPKTESKEPERVKELFRRCHSYGASFGVVEVLGPRGADGEWLKVQVATFRSDGTYSDGRRPDAVTFSSPEEDAQRRDFTINGMFYNPVTKQVIDYVGGQADLKLRVLRAIGNAAERFAEDKLRILRAVRMAARFNASTGRRNRRAGCS